jgi:hypothetical protein
MNWKSGKKLFGLFLIAVAALPLNAQQWGDYLLYSVQNTNKAYLIDNNNNTYHTWTFPTNDKTGYSTYLLPGGDILRTIKYSPNSFAGGGQTGKLQKVDWNGNVTWDFVYSTSAYAMHHDICPMPNGNVLLISYELKTAAQAVQAGCSQSITIWSEKIVEVHQTGATTGEVVWEWHLWDHLVQNYNPAKDNYYPSISDHPELMNINYHTQKDWIHMNGIDYNPILDQITFSSHYLNELYVIDHSTTTAEAATHTGGLSGMGGDLLYRWGNPAAYSVSSTAVFNVVHDAHWIPDGCPDAGRLVAFNNKGYSSTKSTIDQITAPRDGFNYTHTTGTAYLPATYTFRHVCNGGSSSMGGSQQLPNGNMLVCIAMSGLVYEVNSDGTTIWSKTLSGTVPKAYKYSACYVSNPAPGIPVVTEESGALVSTEATTYQWYQNGTQILGANNQSYSPAADGVYSVRITDANGCVYRYSVPMSYLVSTGIGQIEFNKRVNVFPNPTGGVVNVNSGEPVLDLKIFGLSGKLLLEAKETSIIDISGFSQGSYILKVQTTTGNSSHKVFLAK